MVSMKPVLLIYLTALPFYSCETSKGSFIPTTVYFGGDILTMEGDAPEYAEALVTGGNLKIHVVSYIDYVSAALVCSKPGFKKQRNHRQKPMDHGLRGPSGHNDQCSSSIPEREFKGRS